MGYRFRYDLPDLVFSAGTESNAIAADPHYQSAAFITIHAPGALTGTVTVATSKDGSTYSTLQVAGADVTIAADKSARLEYGGWSYMRLESTVSDSVTFSAEAI